MALARRGIEARIFETRSDPIDEGAGIQLGPNATRILIELGLAERLAPSLVAPDHIVVHDGLSGRELTRFPLGPDIRRRHGAPYWVIHRADLYRALGAAVAEEPLITVASGQTVMDVTAGRDGGARIRMAEGGSSDGALLIAADGLWSRLRALLAPTFQLEATGVTAARAVLAIEDVPERFRAPVTGIWLAPDSHVVHYPVHGGQALAIVAIAPGGESGSGWSRDIEATDVVARFPRLPAALGELFDQVPKWRQWALMRGGITFQAAASGGTGNDEALPIVFIGDAAHPIQPFLAQGGAMAIEDAAVFAALYARPGGDAARVIRDFAQLRGKRIAAVQAASIENGRIYHLNGLARSMRNATLGLTPGGLMIRRYDWLYGWQMAKA